MSRSLYAFALALCLAMSAAVVAQESKPADKEFAPGEVTKVADEKLKEYLVYVPTNYDPNKPCAVIFFMHGMGGTPTLGPMKSLTGGKHFIIVGHEYVFKATNGKEDHQTEVANLKRVAKSVGERLNVDKEQMFLGGFSQGGWWTSMLAEYTMDTWAGLIILGSGEHASKFPKPVKVKNKPVFIGAGENDKGFLQFARDARDAYQRRGADVTFEVFEGLGHDANIKSEKLAAWLLEHGPLRQVKSRYAQAERAQKAGRLGEALSIFRDLGEMSETDESCVKSVERAKKLDEQAKAEYEQALKPLDDNQPAKTAVALTKLQATWKGCDYEKQAADKLKDLLDNPEVKAAIQQAEVDAKADVVEQEAQRLEKAKEWEPAIRAYERYVKEFPKATAFDRVKKHLAQLKADKTIQSEIREKKADHDCKDWLQMADNYASAGRTDLAKQYLQKIITSYGDTIWGKQAKEKLAQLK